MPIDTNKTDRYGRTVGKIMVDGRDINLEQVRRGMAWHYAVYEREQEPADRQAYAAAERAAKAAKEGLWAMPSPIAPWDFRRAKKEAAIAESLPAGANQRNVHENGAMDANYGDCHTFTALDSVPKLMPLDGRDKRLDTAPLKRDHIEINMGCQDGRI